MMLQGEQKGSKTILNGKNKPRILKVHYHYWDPKLISHVVIAVILQCQMFVSGQNEAL